MVASNVLEALEQLEADNSRLWKEDVLNHNVGNTLLRRVFLFVYDPYTDFGVRKFKKQLPVSRPGSGAVGSRKTWSADLPNDDEVVSRFLDVLALLASRSLSGNAAKSAVEREFVQMDEKQQKWCERILIKNLRVGVQAKTINKTWPSLINHFAVQLAQTLSVKKVGETLDVTDDVEYPIYVEPKLDGLRIVAVKQKGVVTLHTRNGNVVETLPKVVAALAAADYDDFVLDGEAMADGAGEEAWNQSTSVVMSSKRTKDDSKIVFNVFDGMTLNSWTKQECPLPLEERKKYLALVVSSIYAAALDSKDDVNRVRLVQHVTVNSQDELMKEYVRRLDEGYEGVMLKDLKGLYTFDRSRAILKFKPVTTYEGVVVGWYQGRDGTKHEGLFGGFHVLLPNGVTTRVGGGFTDVNRAEIMLATPQSYVGKIAEVEGQPPLTSEGRVRFPVFLRWRDPRDVDSNVVKVYEAFVKNH